MATQDKPQEAPAVAAAPPKKKRSKLLIAVGVLALLAGGGGAGWYFMQPGQVDSAAAKPKPPIFLPLESFTVNLIPSDGQLQFVQAGLTLKLDDRDAADLIKEHMPHVRDRVLLVLSSKRSAELLPTQGKQKLAAEISDAVRKVIAPPAKAAAPQSLTPSGAQVSAVDSAQAAEKSASAETRPEAKPAPQGPAIDVLFTSFIIQ